MPKGAQFFSSRSNKKQLPIFYAWQTDSPSNTNRNLIEQCLKAAIEQINKDSADYEFVLDKDTSGEVGTPAISDTILRKIQNCYLFVGDVTIINNDQSGRPVPNPNVFFECGYAVSQVGWERVLFLVNKAFGDPDGLPFDIKHRRISTYEYKTPDLLCVDDKAAVDLDILKQNGYLLTKENGEWKFYVIVIKNNMPNFEDYSSSKKYKTFIRNLKKNESTVAPSSLRKVLVNELKGIINKAKNTVKKDLTMLLVDAISAIHNTVTLDQPRKIAKFLENYKTVFFRENRQYSLKQVLSNPRFQDQQLACQLYRAPLKLKQDFENILNFTQYIKIVSTGSMAQNQLGMAHGYKITMFQDFFESL